MPSPDTLRTVESLLLRGSFVASSVVAAWVAIRSFRDRDRELAAGEAVWTLVALLMLAGVLAATAGAGRD